MVSWYLIERARPIGCRGRLARASRGRTDRLGRGNRRGRAGLNLAYAVMPETFADFVDLAVPELQRRRRYKLDYASGTLREKLYGPGRARLVADHLAARFRGLLPNNKPS